MSNLFSQVINMSMTGSVVILLVMLARLILKRSPKIFSYVLWSVVLFRLLCPVAFTAPISVLDVMEPEQREISDNTSIVSYIPVAVDEQIDFVTVQTDEQQIQTEPVAEPEEQLLMIPMQSIALVWAIGTIGLLLYSIAQFLTLQRKLVGSVYLTGNIYLADHIDTAFVVGLLRPRIYLPSKVPSNELYYILAHEHHHIRRRDHVFKLLAYLALCIHWFNPLVWSAFVLSGKDMEMSCDEAVIKKLGVDIRADYSASLLRLATRKKILSGMPLAFGEGDTKGRVLNMSKWKKPAKWLVAICVILCLCIVVVCALNPENNEVASIEELTRRTSDAPVNTAVGDLCYIYPAGLTSEQRDVDNWSTEDTLRNKRRLPTRRPYNNWFIDNGEDFGGVVDFVVPEDREIHLEELNLPAEWVGLEYIAGSAAYPYAEMEYTLIKDGKDYIQMYLYTYSGHGYFLWFYTEQGNQAHKEAILNSVELGSFGTVTAKLKRDEILSLGLFNITIPKGYGYHRNETKMLEITKKDLFQNDAVVCRVTAMPNPKLSLEDDGDVVAWVEALEIDLSNEKMSYSYSLTGDMENVDVYLYCKDVVDGKHVMAENHYFYIAGDVVYDLWFDASQFDWSNQKQFLETVWIKNVATISLNGTYEDTAHVVEAVHTEQEAFAKCRSVMDTVQDSTYKIVSRQVNAGNEGPKGYERIYCRNNENWLSVTNIITEGENNADGKEYAATKSALCVNGRRFGYTGMEWVEIANDENSLLPWMADFTWDDAIVAYMGTEADNNGQCVMFRVDEKYVDADTYAPYYFCSFQFDTGGNFMNVKLQVNLYMENEFTITESIVTLDSETVNAEIQKEYQSAIS